MLKVFEAFSGVGSQHMAIKKITNDFEIVAISEIDRTAILAYFLIHNSEYSGIEKNIASINKIVKNVGDISKVDMRDIPDHNLFTYSFPCQDISTLGKRGGFSKDSGTRSSLLWECAKIIEEKKPKYLILENVKAVATGKNKANFGKWLNFLESLGYENQWKILDSSDFGIPQRRKRVFVVSKYGNIKTDLLKINSFPTLSLLDIIDSNETEWFEFNPKSQVKGNIKDGEIKFLDDRDWKINGVMISNVCSTQRAGRSGLKLLKMDKSKFYERKLNSLECCRLMGFSDEVFYSMSTGGISNSSIMKLCGNSIVVNVIENIIINILEDDKYD